MKVSLIRNLNKGKAHGPDDISAHMLILCDDTIVIPLKLIYEQILITGIFPDIWKSANLNPIHKKVINNLSIITGLFLCYPYVVKSLRKLSSTSYYQKSIWFSFRRFNNISIINPGKRNP